ncbi:MAG: alpha/beta fold hydrolase [Fuerstiella sp.]
MQVAKRHHCLKALTSLADSYRTKTERFRATIRIGVQLSLILFVVDTSLANGQSSFREVSFKTSDGGQVFANLYGKGDHAVVLAHGAIFDKESWHKQAQTLADKGLRVLAIDFRGYGKSKAGTQSGGLHLDVLGAVHYLREHGAKTVTVVGGSMGGGAAARASVASKSGEIDRLILLAHSPVTQPEKLKGRKLFIVSRGDGIRSRVEQQYNSAKQPKKLVVLDGTAHAQHIFKTKHSEDLMKHIVEWLTASD